MRKLGLFLVAGLLFTNYVSAEELPNEVVARFLKIISSASGGKVSTKNMELRAALEAAGVTVDSGASVVWVVNPMEAASMKRMGGKLVICGRREWMQQGAAIVLTGDGGHPKILMNSAAVAASHVVIGDAVAKIAEKN
jgi:hypothetical protein